MIPRSWVEPSSGLAPRDLHVAIALLSFGGSDPAHPAFPSLATLAKLTGLSTRTVRRSLSKMVQLKHLRAHQRTGGTTAYTLDILYRTPDITAVRGVGHVSDQGPQTTHVRQVTPLVSKQISTEQEKEKRDEFRRNLHAVVENLRLVR
jgi:hypothetical protein